jgi:hypothetical protein
MVERAVPASQRQDAPSSCMRNFIGLTLSISALVGLVSGLVLERPTIRSFAQARRLVPWSRQDEVPQTVGRIECDAHAANVALYAEGQFVAPAVLYPIGF